MNWPIYSKSRGNVRRTDYTGQQIGGLTVEAVAPTVSNETRYRCRCECGVVVYRRASGLKQSIRRKEHPACSDCRKARKGKPCRD